MSTTAHLRYRARRRLASVLEPMVDQALHELAAAGVDERLEVVLADAGFFTSAR